MEISWFEFNLDLCAKYLRPGLCHWEALKIARRHDFEFVGPWEVLFDPECSCSTCRVRAKLAGPQDQRGLSESVHEHCPFADGLVANGVDGHGGQDEDCQVANGRLGHAAAYYQVTNEQVTNE